MHRDSLAPQKANSSLLIPALFAYSALYVIDIQILLSTNTTWMLAVSLIRVLALISSLQDLYPMAL